MAPRRYAFLVGGRSLRERKNPERKVRTPQGSPPCESKGALNESSFATESVTENKPLFRAMPAATLGRPGSKGEMAG
jgi:hypothetical protein